MRKSVALCLFALLLAPAYGHAEAVSDPFDEPMFRRCIEWMIDGNRGGLIQEKCADEYDIPPPSLFLCARRVRTGFPSTNDQAGCAIIFEEQAKKVRAGYVR